MSRHPCILGASPNKGGQNQNWLPHPCLLGGPKRGRKCYVTPAFSGCPQTKGDKIRIGCLTTVFSGAQKRVEMSRHRCILGVSPNKGGRNQWLPHPYLLGGPKEGGNATSPLHSRGVPRQRGTKSEVAASPLSSRGPKRGRKCHATPAFLGVPKQRGTKLVAASPLHSHGPKRGRKCHVTSAFLRRPQTKGEKIRIGYLTLAFSGAQKRAQMLCHPCILGASPNNGEQNQKWLPHPYLLGGPKEGGNVTPPLHSRGVPKQRGTKSVAASPLSSRGPKEGGNVTSPLHSRGVPKQRGTKSVAASPLPSRGPKEGGNATSPLHSQGVPKQRGTKSELDASPVPSWGPK